MLDLGLRDHHEGIWEFGKFCKEWSVRNYGERDGCLELERMNDEVRYIKLEREECWDVVCGRSRPQVKSLVSYDIA